MGERLATLLEEWTKAGVETVRFETPDLHGVSRSKFVPLTAVEHFATRGLNMYGALQGLDTSSNVVHGLAYWEERGFPDQLLKPDLDTAALVPWAPRTARLICDSEYLDGRKLEFAPRMLLRRALAELEALGYEAVMGHEYEFYLLDAGTKEPLFPGLHIFNTLRTVKVPAIEEIVSGLRGIGIRVITTNCEYAPSQWEINYAPEKGVRAGDAAYTLKNGVKEMAQRAGLLATFMTMPFNGQSASGCHFHISLVRRSDGSNAFADPGAPDGLSQVCRQFVAGQLRHAAACMALMAPTVNCYRRYRPGTFAPANISWGYEDRTALLRIKGGENTHVENRLATAVANPYLVAAAAAAAGVIGLREGLTPPPPCKGLAHADKTAPPLPRSLEEALRALEGDGAMRELLGEEFVALFTGVKRYEVTRFSDYVTDWERAEYLEIH